MPGGSASKAPPDLNTVTRSQSWCAALLNLFFLFAWLRLQACLELPVDLKKTPKYCKMSTNWGMRRKGPTKMTDIWFGFVIPLWFLLWFSEAPVTKVFQRTHPYLAVKYLFHVFQIVLIYSVMSLLIRWLLLNQDLFWLYCLITHFAYFPSFSVTTANNTALLFSILIKSLKHALWKSTDDYCLLQETFSLGVIMDTSTFVVLTSSNATVLHTYLCNRYIDIEEKTNSPFFCMKEWGIMGSVVGIGSKGRTFNSKLWTHFKKWRGAFSAVPKVFFSSAFHSDDSTFLSKIQSPGNKTTSAAGGLFVWHVAGWSRM